MKCPITNVNDPRYAPVVDLHSFNKGYALATYNLAHLIRRFIENGWTAEEVVNFLQHQYPDGDE